VDVGVEKAGSVIDAETAMAAKIPRVHLIFIACSLSVRGPRP
jgi:hypothetical protein